MVFYSLFSGIVQLVFVAAREALLDTGILPEAFHGGQQLLREGFGVVHPLAHVEHHLGIALQGGREVPGESQ